MRGSKAIIAALILATIAAPGQSEASGLTEAFKAIMREIGELLGRSPKKAPPPPTHAPHIPDTSSTGMPPAVGPVTTAVGRKIRELQIRELRKPDCWDLRRLRSGERIAVVGPEPIIVYTLPYPGSAPKRTIRSAFKVAEGLTTFESSAMPPDILTFLSLIEPFSGDCWLEVMSLEESSQGFIKAPLGVYVLD
jgi:hypothetical protein